MTRRRYGQSGFSTPLAVAAALVLGAALVVAACLLLFDTTPEEEKAAAGAGGGDHGGRSVTESTEAGGPFDEVEKRSYDGKGVAISGRVLLEGAALSGVKVVAWDDRPERISASMSAMMQATRSIFGTEDLDGEEADGKQKKRAGAAPDYRADSGGDGSFSFTSIPSETITFSLDHDFYTLSNQSRGPHIWAFEEDVAALPSFNGKLRARLGAMIKGTVNDHNGFPVKGAVVALDQEDRGNNSLFVGFFGSGGLSYLGNETITDHDGEFSLRGVEPGQNLYLTVSEAEAAPYRSDNFQALPGETVRQKIVLSPGASIRVKVYGPDGKGLENAEVSVGEKKEQGSAQFNPFIRYLGHDLVVKKDRTGKDGKVVFSCLSLGDYVVRAAATGLLESREGEAVVLEREEEVQSVELNLGWGASIAGIVKDERERPVAGAVIRARPDSDGDMFNKIRRGLGDLAAHQKESIAAEDGSFRITGLKHDTDYRIIAAATGYTVAERNKVESGKEDLTMVLERPGQIEGEVLRAVDGKPVKSFRIRITPVEDSLAGRGNRLGPMRNLGYGSSLPGRGGRGSGKVSAPLANVMESARRTVEDLLESTPGPTDRKDEFNNKKGKFSLKDIVPGQYNLCVTADGYTPTLTDVLTVEKGVTIRQTTVRLGKGASISGEVNDPDGPVEGASVQIARNKDRSREESLLIAEARTTETDKNGRFRLDSLPAGKFVLDASHEEHPKVSTEEIALTNGLEVKNVRILMPTGGSIKGLAISAGGTPLIATNIVCGDRFTKMERTDDEGRFEFKGLEEGSYTIRIFSRNTGFFRRGSEDQPGSVTVFVAEGDVQEVVLTEQPLEGVTVHGKVTDSGAPLSSGFLSVSPEGGGAGRSSNWGSATIGSDGTYSVEGVSPGWNRFSIRNPSTGAFDNITLRFEIPDVPKYFLGIELPTGTVGGTVLDAAAGLPLEGISVRLIGEKESGEGAGSRRRWGSYRSTRSGSDGSFSFNKVSAGAYTVRAEPSREMEGVHGTGFRTGEINGLAVADAQSVRGLEIKLQQGGAIEVTASDSDGQPLNRAFVSAVSKSTEGRTVRNRTDEAGTTRLLGLPPGEYNVTVTAGGMGQAFEKGIRLEEGRVRKIAITLEKGYPVTVRLADENGQPVESALIQVNDSRGNSLTTRSGLRGLGRAGSGREVEAGSYYLGTLAPGSYTLRATWAPEPGGEKISGKGSFSVSGEETISLTIRGESLKK